LDGDWFNGLRDPFHATLELTGPGSTEPELDREVFNLMPPLVLVELMLILILPLLLCLWVEAPLVPISRLAVDDFVDAENGENDDTCHFVVSATAESMADIDFDDAVDDDRTLCPPP
jgi:hypothetical protein